VTPATELQELSIGSRPARRRMTSGIAGLRAIPWVFAWTQIRMMLPAWLGTVETLQEAMNGGQRTALSDMRQHWPYFRNLMGMLEMVLAKTEPEIARDYERHLGDERLAAFGAELRRQLLEAIGTIKQITGQRQLLAGSPVIRRSIDVRNPYTDVLNLLQAEALRRYRMSGAGKDRVIKEALLTTIIGVAAGLRNTG
jgi:phosphoenolpyruvate carboxylase